MNGPRSKCREQTLIGAASHTVISHTYRNLFSFMCASRFLYKQSSSTSLIGVHNYCTILKIVAQASKFLLAWQPLSYSNLFHTIGPRSEREAVCSTPYMYTCRSWKKPLNLGLTVTMSLTLKGRFFIVIIIVWTVTFDYCKLLVILQ